MKLIINIPDDIHNKLSAHATLDGVQVTEEYLRGLYLYLLFREEYANKGRVPVIAELNRRGDVTDVWGVTNWKP